jgi:signal transduction histidine kinase/CheY-like chemotaxis protein
MGERSAGHLNLEDFYRANDIQTENLRQEVSECLKNGKDIMFYHNVQGKNALNYMWAVNGGSTYLVGYVPVEAIQKEGKTVNQNINTVVFTMLIAFALCCILFYVNRRQQDKIRKERDEERELYNKQLAEALQAAQVANNSKTTFLSNMSHDIRTPMNAVLGYTTLLAKDAENPDKVREYTKKILTSGRHLLSLINDILDISKIESGKVVLNFGRFAFTDLVSTVEDIVRPMSEEKHQKFSVEISGIEHKYFMGDDTRVNQILFNLLSNAVKYTPEGGNIWLRLIGLPQRTAQFEHIRIEVEDNGFGMAPAFLETIFDAFTRAENSTTNKVQGTGLGMAITKNIVELMGGTIQVFSEVDKGSLFRIELEFRISEEQAESKEECLTDINNSSLEGLHFLAAEDNEINAEILSEILEMEGADCVIVENGKLALERFKNSAAGEFDAVLMDVQMPVMNGYEATRAIRSLERRDAKTIPIIAMTANAFAEDEKDALEAGMNVHVAKPIDIEVLKRAIKQCIMGGNMS